MATRPTTCPKPGTSHSPFSSGSHLSVLVTVEAFQADLVLSEQLIDLDARGQTPVKRVKHSTQQLQRRLRSLCEHRRKSVAETLRGLGHCIRFEEK